MGKAWTDEEENLLKEHYKTDGKKALAKRLGRTVASIESKAHALGVWERKREKRNSWTKDDLDFLQDRWGQISFKTIAQKLNRSVDAVKQKAFDLSLGDASLSFEGITLHQLALATNISYSVYKNWVNLYDFPIKRKVFAYEMKVQVVRYHDWWKWAEKNKQMIDFSRIEKNILGAEPDWVEGKRNADFIKRTKIKKSHNQAWTTEEDNILKGMLNAYKHTYPEIAQRVNRSEGAVKRRILDLGLKARPIRLNNHIKYTPEEVKMIETLFDKGHCLEDIASRMNKSAIGVRGKMERMGYTFRNGVPSKKKEKKSDKELILSGFSKIVPTAERIGQPY
ncbi:hypothetical protein J7E79_02830 [Bacillus sp. ISL-40]|uniref:hypothetical protein n=1 Tax=unclassified Bacillus (in: firmicutes) TaxID=185979 RepID=UPI001BE9A26A|nr:MULTISPECIES: hypothetical protein [unclassified Bacillus (in: firmicutes)]MBT2696371.1 hypothetical protein [Bacillus sp. ISL-40]MBT2743219.1 hypothetical protein [Bacillus sp. ISL-77]